MRVRIQNVRAGFALAGLTMLLASCDGDSVVAPGGETEVISRVTLTLTSATGTALTSYIDDADGNGPNAPSAQVGALSLPVGTSWTGVVRFENRTVTPIANITDEVRTEANAHRVFYSIAGTGVTASSTDIDGAGKPLGLAFTVAAPTGTTAGARTLRVLLCHYDAAVKPAVASSCSADTDIDVSFTVTVP